MKRIKIKDTEELKKIFESFGYFPTKEILVEAYLGLKKFGSSSGVGQDIYAMCFDGPPGAGKSSFVEAYSRVVEFYLDEKIEIINYQCNDTTGSGELVEDVGMVAVVVKDDKKIIIPCAITRAIQAVNKGKKVILFLDEFDKSRKETDVFFYGFLQSGKLNTVQLEDLGRDSKYKGNLQVVFCKNDFRELTGPLVRRTRNVILEYMKPNLFYDVAINKFIGINEPTGIRTLINLITLIYDLAYRNQKIFDRLPAASEMLIAIEDAYELTTGLNLEGKDIYSVIFRRLFKNPDDFTSFERLLSSTTEKEYEGLRDFLDGLKTDEEEVTIEVLTEKMADDVFKSFMDEKTKEIEEKIKELEEQKRLLIEERISLRNGSSSGAVSKIILNGVDLVLSDNNSIMRNFDDSTETIRRGESIFNVVNNANWTSIASVTFNQNNHLQFVQEIKDLADDFGYKIYEDGFLLNNNQIALGLIASQNSDNSVAYSFVASSQIVPSTYVGALYDYIDVFKDSIGEIIKISVKALMYNDSVLSLDTVLDNVYSLDVKVNTLDELDKILGSLDIECKDKSRVLESCIELMDNHGKKLVR